MTKQKKFLVKKKTLLTKENSEKTKKIEKTKAEKTKNEKTKTEKTKTPEKIKRTSSVSDKNKKVVTTEATSKKTIKKTKNTEETNKKRHHHHHHKKQEFELTDVHKKLLHMAKREYNLYSTLDLNSMTNDEIIHYLKKNISSDPEKVIIKVYRDMSEVKKKRRSSLLRPPKNEQRNRDTEDD
jgi:hypothetical protein